MIDKSKIENAEPGDTIAKLNGTEITYGKITAISPRKTHLKVQWENGRSTTVHHRKAQNILMTDHRQRKNRIAGKPPTGNNGS